jgi:hypothetical protein
MFDKYRAACEACGARDIRVVRVESSQEAWRIITLSSRVTILRAALSLAGDSEADSDSAAIQLAETILSLVDQGRAR